MHYRACPLCEAICGLEIETQGDRVVSIRGDKEDPLSRGYLCPKAYALKDLHEDADRLKKPLRRRGRDFEEVSWEVALAEAGQGLGRLRKAHGRWAVASYLGNPTVHNLGAGLGAILLLRTLRSRSRFSATTLDQGPRQLACYWMYGSQALLPVPDLDRTRFLLVLGANPVVSNGSLMTAPGMKGRLEAIRARGGKVVVVDPRRSETAEVADQHVFIRPGTDGFFLAALVHVLFEDGLVRLGRLEPHIRGVDAVRGATAPFSPERTAERTGIPAATVRALAHALADADGGAVYGRIGTCTQRTGTVSSWLQDVANILCGHLDRPGGVMFTTPALDVPALAKKTGLVGHQGLWRSRVRGVPESLGELPTAVLAEEITTPGDDRIRGLVTVAGNPVLSSPSGDKLAAALGRLELMVSVDFYVNETTRHAHYILPPVSPLEKDHADLALHALAVRNTIRYSPRVIEPPPGSKTDWDILSALVRHIARAQGPRAAVEAELATRAFSPDRALELLLRTGPHGAGLGSLLGRGLTLGKLKAAPHGIDLGPLEPRLPGLLGTSDRKIQLAPPLPLEALAALRCELGAARGTSLVLVGRRELRTNNSWMHNSPSLTKGPSRCTLLMHPSDAAGRGITDGARVRVQSRAGAIEVAVALTDEVMAGVVSLPHGYGHEGAPARQAVAARVPGANVNVLTDPDVLEPLSGTAVLSGVPVEVQPAA